MESQKNNSKDYYLEIQQKLAGRRHNRGKRHALAFVAVVLFLTSILPADKLLNVSVLKQKQANNKSLDLAEEVHRMSEPGSVLLALLLGVFLWYRETRKKQFVR